MRTENKIDFSKLFGFNVVSLDPGSTVDFRNEATDAKLGAKVGKSEMAPVLLAELAKGPSSR